MVLLVLLRTSSSSQQQQRRHCVFVYGFVCKYIQKSVTEWGSSAHTILEVSSKIYMIIYIELSGLSHLSYLKFSQLYCLQVLHILHPPIYLLLASISVLGKDLSTHGRNDTDSGSVFSYPFLPGFGVIFLIYRENQNMKSQSSRRLWNRYPQFCLHYTSWRVEHSSFL